ncbi:MAG TPA: DJ-1 family protein [Verrucomicrobia bacterium]|nr:DJ-1 family protein [Verrucomicrobiota bacterium]HCG20342.1 DJ-1 family protein [Verrucomicrobiota bacterium]
MIRALVPLTDGFEEMEAVTLIDVLRRGGVHVVTAALAPSLEVEGAHGMILRADALFAEVSPAEYDALVLPGGPGVENMRRCGALLERVRRQKAEGRLLAAICAAPLVLVEAGVLEPGQRVTCYPSCAVGLDRPCAGVPVVVDGRIVTGQAPGAALAFALAVLGVLKGEAIVKQVADGLVARTV